jgi:hypothetical protein
MPRVLEAILRACKERGASMHGTGQASL